MLRTKKAKRMLTKKEQKHLTESGINSLIAMNKQVELMKNKEPSEVCFDCKTIAVKLGIMT